jgi:hypothetical protein
MATRRQTIVRRVSELEKLVKESNEEIERLTDELSSTPGDFLDIDPEEEKRASIQAKNDFLRANGLLPRK